MKKTRFLFLLLAVGIVLVSCQEDTVKEWQQFYDFTLDDIKGTYTYSYVSNAFDGLTENTFCHICEDTDVTVSSYLGSDSSIEFKVNSQKAMFNKSFTGKPAINDEDAFLMKMSIPTSTLYPDYELTAYVYKNAKGDIRLHGFAQHIVYEDGIEEGTTIHYVKTVTNYYFDVKKQ